MTNLTKHFIFILIISLFILCSCDKSELANDDLTTRIDSIFQKWDNDYSPGGAIAVTDDGKLIFTKGYGMGNLEYDKPNAPSTIFHIASESKQFTAFCIVLLAQEGKLSLDDDIRKYLPEIPDFGVVITIKNLIYHTSGIRDQWQLLAISGTRIDDVIKQGHIMKLVKKQERLNFDPGERMLYCNTGYTLLAEIVKKVSGQSLREYAEAEIFKPLGMRNTHFHNDYKEVVKGRAYSYKPIDSVSFENSILSFSTVGATSLFTTVEDEIKWLNNYKTGKVGGKDAISQMFELCVLNSGDTLDYAFGLGIDKYKGWKRIGHGGSDAGYRSYTVRFPEKDLGIVVFSNISNFDPRGKALKIADLFLEDKSPSKKSSSNIVVENKRFSENLGNYHNEEGIVCELVDSVNLYLKNDGKLVEMIPLTDLSFSIDGVVTILFKEGIRNSFDVKVNNEQYTVEKYDPVTLSSSEKEMYQGVYRSQELDARYQIIYENDSLKLTHLKYEDASLSPITKNHFSSSHWSMKNLIFHRDEYNNIIGFEVNSGRVLHLYFDKVNL